MSIYRNTIRMQMKLMCNKKAFQLAFAINLAYALLTYLYYVWIQLGHDISTITSPSVVFPLQSATEFFDMYINIVPFIVVIAFSMSYITDKSNAILPALQTRCGSQKYYFSKGIVCFCGGFLVFFIPFMLSILFNHLTFPQSGITFLGDLYDRNYDPGIVGSNVLKPTKWLGICFPKLFIFNQELYNILYLLIFSLAMGLFSVFTYSLSFIIKKNKIILLLPVYLIIISFNTLDQFMQSNVPYICYKVLLYITVNNMYGKNPFFIVMFFLILATIAAILIVKQSWADQID